MSTAKVITLHDVFKTEEPKSYLGSKVSELKKAVEIDEAPSFPRVIMVELSNICNHRCTFCAITSMQRAKNYIDPEVFRRIVAEAHDLGAREVSLVGGAEPLANKKLEEYIKFCSDLGFEYIYFTTNATLADEQRWKRLIDAGLHSIKISINGGTPESYARIHGQNQCQP